MSRHLRVSHLLMSSCLKILYKRLPQSQHWQPFDRCIRRQRCVAPKKQLFDFYACWTRTTAFPCDLGTVGLSVKLCLLFCHHPAVFRVSVLGGMSCLLLHVSAEVRCPEMLFLKSLLQVPASVTPSLSSEIFVVTSCNHVHWLAAVRRNSLSSFLTLQ